MANAFSLFGTIGVNTNPLKQGLDQAERELKEFEGSMKSAGSASQTFGKQVDSAGPSLQNLSSRLDEVGQGMVQAGAALTAGLTVPLVALGGMATKSALDMEKLNAGLTAVMGSADRASAEFVKLREVAKLPGLGLKEAVQGSINLQAAGLSADLARRALQSFGNALATVGKGKNELDGVILALTQMQGKGKVAGQEIQQLAERVPQIRQIMMAAFGTADTEKLQKMGLTSEQFISRIITELEKLPPVATTASGQLENLGDTIDQALLPLGKRITALIAPAVAMLDPLVANLGAAFDSLATPIQYVIIAIGAVAAAIGPLLVSAGGLAFAITSITGLMATLGITTMAALTPILVIVAKVALVIAGLAAVAYVAYKAYQTNFAGIKDIVDSTIGLIISVFEGLRSTLEPLITNMLDSIKAFWSDNSADIIGVVEFFVEAVIKPFKTMVQILLALWQNYGDRFLSGVKTVFNLIVGNLTRYFDNIVQLFKLVGNLMTGNWAGAWENIKRILSNAWTSISTTFTTAGTALWNSLKAIGNGLLTILSKAADKALEYGAKFISEFGRGLLTTGTLGGAVARSLGIVLVQGVTDASTALNGIALPALTSFNAAVSTTNETVKDTAKNATGLANAMGKAGGGGGGGGKSVAQAADEAAEAIARTRMEILLYGKETRLAKFDTELAAGAMKGWTQAQIEFQRWQLLNLDLMDNSTKAVERNKRAMDELIKSLEKASEIDIKPLMPKTPTDGGRSFFDRRGPIDLGPMEPPPIAPWDTFFGKVKAGLDKLKADLPSFKDQLANTVVGFVDMFGNAFANAVNQWDGTLKGFLNSLASTFRSFIKSVIAELMRLVAIRAATKIFEMMGLFGGAKAPVFNNPFDLRNSVPFGFKASGGLITGPGSGTSDSIPTMLSNGEYVIPAASVRKFGVGFFEALRQGAMPFAMPSPAMATAGSQSNQTMNNNFNINVSGGGDAQKTGAMVQREILTALQKTQRRNR